MILRIAAPVAVLAALCLAAAAPAAAKSPLEPASGSARQCFSTRDVTGFAAADEKVVNIRVDVKDIYRFEMLRRCHDVDWNNQIALVSRGSDYICTGIDAEIISPTSIGPRRCPVKTIRKLSPEEVKALPKRAQP